MLNMIQKMIKKIISHQIVYLKKIIKIFSHQIIQTKSVLLKFTTKKQIILIIKKFQQFQKIQIILN